MSEYERAAETDVFRTGNTSHKIFKQKLTPHTGYNWLYVVLSYFLCTACRLQSSMSNYRDISSLFAQKLLPELTRKWHSRCRVYGLCRICWA